MTRPAALALWVVLCALAFGLSPPSRPDQTAWLVDLMLGRVAGENPVVVAEFWGMGVWSGLMALLLRDHWRARPVPAWPFLLGSLALGCFVLLPWFFLRRSREPSGPPAPGWVRHPALPGALGLAGLLLLGWAAVAGDWAAFAHTVRTDGFVWPMTFDFAAMAVLFATEARVRAAESRAPWPVTLVPLVGPAAWLALRRPHFLR